MGPRSASHQGHTCDHSLCFLLKGHCCHKRVMVKETESRSFCAERQRNIKIHYRVSLLLFFLICQELILFLATENIVLSQNFQIVWSRLCVPGLPLAGEEGGADISLAPLSLPQPALASPQVSTCLWASAPGIPLLPSLPTLCHRSMQKRPFS